MKKRATGFPKYLDLRQGGVNVTALTFGITLYANSPFTEISKPLLAVFESFLALVPPEELTFLSTENMTKHTPVKGRTRSLLESWLKPGAAPRKYINLMLKEGKVYHETPRRMVKIYGTERSAKDFKDQEPSAVSMAFPPEWGHQRTQELFALVRMLADAFPFQSGNAGFTFEVSPYEARPSEIHAYKMSMRHRGIDIHNMINDRIAVRADGVRTVNWLTLLSPARIEEAGGEKSLRKLLPSSVEWISLKKGVILKAGAQPDIEGTPAYRAVHRALKPLLEKTALRYPPLMLSSMDFKKRTLDWALRLDGR